MKKLMALILAFSMLFVFAACGATMMETVDASDSAGSSAAMESAVDGTPSDGYSSAAEGPAVAALEKAASLEKLGLPEDGGVILETESAVLEDAAPADGGVFPDAEPFSADMEAEFPAEIMIDASEPVELSEPSRPQSGTLTAGEWKDLDDLDFWTGLLTREEWRDYEYRWNLYAEDFVTVHLTSSGAPAAFREVTLTGDGNAIFTGVTDINGNVTLFWNTEKKTDANGGAENGETPDGLLIDGTACEAEIRKGDVISMDIAEAGPTGFCDKLDLMLMVDTTGSMGDEMEYLKAELATIVRSVQNKNADAQIRISVNFYKDEGDRYVVQDNPFTTSVKDCVALLDDEYADGGGDTPEAVDRALETAAAADWDEDAVKLCFLVLDAPPHEDDASLRKVKTAMASLAEQGIRVIPVAASGIEKADEYIFRCFSVFTGGTYVFLTDDSGVGNSHLEPTIGDYDVELLRDCMIRIICEYCGL